MAAWPATSGAGCVMPRDSPPISNDTRAPDARTRGTVPSIRNRRISGTDGYVAGRAVRVGNHYGTHRYFAFFEAEIVAARYR